jgi:hypothetical protein
LSGAHGGRQSAEPKTPSVLVSESFWTYFFEVIAMPNTNRTGTQGPSRIDLAYCPICTHTVQAEIIWGAKRLMVKPGQKCSHCHSPLDAGYVMRREQAA